MATAALVGSTGLVGSQILSTLLTSANYSRVHAYTRRDLTADPKLSAIKSPDTDSWPASFPKDATIFYSGLGTTRAQAGGLANQRKIDLDLNAALAKAAKESGAKVYVLISSGAASSKSVFPYMKLKGELEDEVRSLGFDHCIILRPGLLLGHRKESRWTESALQSLFRAIGKVTPGLRDAWSVDDVVVARAAVSAGTRALEGKDTEKVRIVEHAEIVRLGKTEWK